MSPSFKAYVNTDCVFNHSLFSVCDQYSFQCEDTDVCIPNFYVCDGEENCEDGSDEMRCGRLLLKTLT